MHSPAAGRGARGAPGARSACSCFALMAMWALTMPLMAAPDEPSHVVKAAAVSRGQLGGVLGDAPKDTSEPGAPTWVQVPSDLADLQDFPDCFRFDGDSSADCTSPLADRQPG